MTTVSEKQTLSFKTESMQLLNLMIDKIYKNKEIFLRELISNAHDAIEKLRFKALSNPQIYEEDASTKIALITDKDKRTITVIDNGIGMTWNEVISNLGTIAKSGTKEFLDSLTGDIDQDTQLIGQFGVGFYAAFMVANKVTVKTRAAEKLPEDGVFWEYNRDSKEGYTIEKVTKLDRGTEICLYLKKEKDIDEFLEDWRLQGIITKYSDHINFPISMKKNVTQKEEASDSEKSQSVEKDTNWETINTGTALWTLSKDKITDEAYRKFYTYLTQDQQDPFTWIHNKIEGSQEYTTLLYLPLQSGPIDFWSHEKPRGLKLYVKRVFIMDDAEQFLPRYLRFVKGIVDSNDLPLNISREVLQNNKQIDNIRSAITKRILETLNYLSKEQTEKYLQFWKEFGNILKEGFAEDFVNRDSLAKLLRFSSTHLNKSEQTISLEDYITRMKPEQDKIYYITAESFAAASHSPNLEIFLKKEIEVLLLHDRIDEWLVAHLTEFGGKRLQSVAKDSDISEIAEEKNEEQQKQYEEEFGSLLKHIHEILKDKVKEVRISQRLTSSPACIVKEQNALNSQIRRMLEATGQKMPESKPILELNTQHKFIRDLKDEQDDARLTEWSHLLLSQSILAEGEQLDDPAGFVRTLNNILMTNKT